MPKIVDTYLPTIWEMPTPGESGFNEAFDEAKRICRCIRPGTKLVYIGPDDYKFKNWHPIRHGEIVTVQGPIWGKIAVWTNQFDGEPIGLNLYSLAYLPTRYYEESTNEQD